MILLGFLRAKAVFDELQRLGVNPKHLRASSAGANEPIPEMLKVSGVTAQQANAFVEILEVSE